MFLNKEMFSNVSGTITVPQSPLETIGIEFLLEKSDPSEIFYHPQCGAMLPFGRTMDIYASYMRDGCELTRSGNPRPIYEFWLSAEEGTEIRPGDTIGIFPRNCGKVVQNLIDKQEWRADVPFKLNFLPSCKKKKTLTFIPEKGSTIRQVLTHCIDLEKPPSKLFLLALLKYCSSEDEQQALRILCSKENMEMYKVHIMEKRVSVVDFLIGTQIRIPFSVLVEHASRLLPRPYSIINCPSDTERSIRIAFSWNAVRPGITTSMLRGQILDTGTPEPIYYYLRQPTLFRLEVQDVHRYLVMIGPGLGVIPYLGMLQATNDTLYHKRIVFTSWRNKDNDDVYLAELQELCAELNYSYTRDDQEHKKVYVQDLILTKRKQDIANLLTEQSDSKFFICGEGKTMIPAIEAALLKCMQDIHGLTKEESQEKLKQLKEQKRLVAEQWF